MLSKIILHQINTDMRIFNLGSYCFQKTKKKTTDVDYIPCSQCYSRKLKNELKKLEKKKQANNFFLKKFVFRKMK